MSQHVFLLPGHSEPLTVTLEKTSEGWALQSGDERVQGQIVDAASGQTWLLDAENRVQPFYSHREGNRLWLWMAGKVYELEVAEQGPRRAGATSTGPASGDVKAPMPGTILQLKVAEGEAVEAGQPLVIMESMKMEMTLSAPKAGWVAKISAQPGQLVEMGALLVKMEAVEESSR